jgi:hypothetical protein
MRFKTLYFADIIEEEHGQSRQPRFFRLSERLMVDAALGINGNQTKIKKRIVMLTIK